MDYKIIVGLPAYNEADALPKLLNELIYLHHTLGSSLQIIVVNDGSTDQTAQVLEDYSARLSFLKYVSHPDNKGLGAAVKTLFKYSLENFSIQDILVILDADNTHSPRIIPEMVRKLKSEGLNLVIASRFIDGGREIGLSLNRKICSRAAAWLLHFFYPIPNVHDYSCGYRAYDLAYLQQAMDVYRGQLITTDGFECMAEILARFSKIGIKAGEYPLVLSYQLKEGKSKMRIARTILGYLRLLNKIKSPLLTR